MYMKIHAKYYFEINKYFSLCAELPNLAFVPKPGEGENYWGGGIRETLQQG